MKAAPRRSFAQRVYATVRRIPPGRVATYGQVAALSGHPGASRAVGTALSRLPAHLQPLVPWQRVISIAGISRLRTPEGALNQRDLLRSEGIAAQASGHIDLRRHPWSGSVKDRRRPTPRTKPAKAPEPPEESVRHGIVLASSQ